MKGNKFNQKQNIDDEVQKVNLSNFKKGNFSSNATDCLILFTKDILDYLEIKILNEENKIFEDEFIIPINKISQRNIKIKKNEREENQEDNRKENKVKFEEFPNENDFQGDNEESKKCFFYQLFVTFL